MTPAPCTRWCLPALLAALVSTSCAPPPTPQSQVGRRRFALTGVGSAIIDEDKPLGVGCFTSSAYFNDYSGAGTDGRNDDGSSPAQTLPFTPNFFGRTFNQLFVNNNGNLTLD